MSTPRIALNLAVILTFISSTFFLPASSASSQEVISEAPLTELQVCPTCFYTNIQDALDAANPGDVIKVAGGTYSGVNDHGGLSQLAYINKSITLQGGYTEENWITPDPQAHQTILDAGNQGRVIYANGAIETTIDGFHLTNGNAAGLGGNPLNDGDAGGGLYARNATISLLNSQVYSNTAVNGGGIFMTENIFSINDNQIFSNTASIGGGIHIYANDAGVIDGNEIYANDAPSGGGFFSRVLRDTTFSTNTVHDNYREGIYINGSTNTTFENNTIASNQGCGFYQRSGANTLEHNTIFDNSAGGVVMNSASGTLYANQIISNTNDDGGGVWLGVALYGWPGYDIVENVIANNHATQNGGGIFMSVPVPSQMHGNIIENNRADNNGGGLYQNSGPFVSNEDIIRDNISGASGGGIYLASTADVQLNNTVVIENQAGSNGSGIYVWKGELGSLRHTTIANNTGGDGSGIYLYEFGVQTRLVMTNTIVTNQEVGIFAQGGSTVDLESVLWYANTANIGGSGSININHEYSGDPAFAMDGYHLTAPSAAIDAGVESGVTVDIDGETRPAGAGYDLGADEYDTTPLFPDLLITDLWSEGEQIWYQVRNNGFESAAPGHISRLFVNDIPLSDNTVGLSLDAGARSSRSFAATWLCAAPSDVLRVCADHAGSVAEADETNNCREETWSCDRVSPHITNGPSVSMVTNHSAQISWQTDEPADSLVRYSNQGGVYDQQSGDQTLTLNHQITLTDLQPYTVYHYIIQSTDAYANRVVTRDAFFETLMLSDTEPPSVQSVTITRGPGALEHYILTAEVTDNIGVERVEFYMDDHLIGTDYAANSPYQAYLVPGTLGISRADFFTNHTIEVVVFDTSGLSIANPVQFIPPNEPMSHEVEILSPPPDYVIEIPGSSVPPGTIVNIKVCATEYEWETNFLEKPVFLPIGYFANLPTVTEMADAAPIVEFYVDGIWKYTSQRSNEHDCLHSYAWDAEGLAVGIHQIEEWVELSDGSRHRYQHEVRVEQRFPSIEVTRDVTRTGTSFLIKLTIQNTGDVTAWIDMVEEHLQGFQPIYKATPDYTVTPAGTTTQQCDLIIDLFWGAHSEYPIQPGEDFQVEYTVVPFLYPMYFDRAIGSPETIVHYGYAGETYQRSFNRPAVMAFDPSKGGELSLAIAEYNALKAADYLLVTNLDTIIRMHTHQFSPHISDQNLLLSEMAHLASLESGVLGYLTAINGNQNPLESNLDPETGGWARQLSPTFSETGQGYLLIVGEIEVIPAWLDTSWNFTWSTKNCTITDVDISDLPYADTGGNDAAPELIVGRVIGNSALRLLMPIQASIGVLEGQGEYGFDRSHALLVSGTDPNHPAQEQSFVDDIDDIEDILNDEFVVDVLHWRDYPTTPQADEFKNRDAGIDVLAYRNHGISYGWNHFHTDDFAGDPNANPPIPPVNFEGNNPIVTGFACLTGHYEMHTANTACGNYDDGGDTSIAERFLEFGAAVYIGSTEISFTDANSRTSKDFYDDWWLPNTSAGEALLNLKRDIWGTDDFRDFWVWEYNLYGDPKFGSAPAANSALASIASQHPALGPLDMVQVSVPDYVLTSRNGLDEVEIPGGLMMFEEAQPLVPTYDITLEYPAGQKVQDVVLIERSGLITTTGLLLPTATVGIQWDSEGYGVVTETIVEDWFPASEQQFRWQVDTGADGTSTLKITLYPFYYNPLTTDVRFYKDYQFEIQTITAAVRVDQLTTDHGIYQQGDHVLAELWVENPGIEQDVLVNSYITTDRSAEIVAGLPIESLHAQQGMASLLVDWDSTGMTPGYYRFHVELRDAAGKLLDSENERFRLGIMNGEVASLAAAPDLFYPGETVEVSMVFSNTGTLPITGTAVFQVESLAGEVVWETTQSLNGIPAQAFTTIEAGWDTTGIPYGVYHLQGFVLFDASSTEPKRLILNTSSKYYLPMVRK